MAPVPDGNREGPNRNDPETSDFGTPQVNIEMDSESSSSDDDEFSAYMGYQLLPQDPEAGGVNEADEDPGAESEEIPGMESTFRESLESQGQQHAISGLAENLPPVSNTAAEERRAVWNKSASSSTQSMDADQVHKIKSAMANFKLPTPDWARTIPEDKWKEQLFQRLSPGVSTVQDSLTKDWSVKTAGISCGDCEKGQTNTQESLEDKASESVQNFGENQLTVNEQAENSATDKDKT